MRRSWAQLIKRIYDIGDPFNPVLLSQTPTLSGVYGIDIDGSRVAIATWDTVVMFDISDPSAPLELGRYDNGHWTADGIALNDDRVHLSAWPGGLQILEVKMCLPELGPFPPPTAID